MNEQHNKEEDYTSPDPRTMGEPQDSGLDDSDFHDWLIELVKDLTGRTYEDLSDQALKDRDFGAPDGVYDSGLGDSEFLGWLINLAETNTGKTEEELYEQALTDINEGRYERRS